MQINVQILPEGVLEISGSSKTNGEKSENQYHIRELSYGSFKRQLRLPENIEGEPVAELKDGILTLTFKLQLPEEKTARSQEDPDSEELTASSETDKDWAGSKFPISL